MWLYDLVILAPVVQAGVSLVGFGLVFWQLIVLRRNVEGATQDRLYAHYTEICKLFIANPHLRPYFYNSEPAPDANPTDRPALRHEIDAMSETILGLIEHAVVQHANLPSDSWSHCWQPYAVERVLKSEPVRKFYKENKDWYAATLRKQIEIILADADRKGRRLIAQ